MRKGIIAFCVSALLTPFFLSSCKSKKEEIPAPEMNDSIVKITKEQSTHLSYDTSKLVNERSILTLTGKISFDENKVVKIFPLVSGKVLKVDVTLGDKVAKGQELALIRSVEINDIQNQYSIAQSALLVAKKNLDIAEELYKTNVSSERDYMNYQNDYQKAKSDVNRLKEQLSIYGATEDQVDAIYKVIAPCDGYVVDKNITENMEIRTDNASNIFTVSALNTVWVIASVYETDVSKVNVNDDVEVTTLSYPDRILKGKIQQIGSLLDPISKTLSVRIVLNNPDGTLKPEMFATIKVHIKRPNKVISIATNSLVFDDGAFYVMIRQSDETYLRKKVHLIKTMDQTSYIEGIKDHVILVDDGAIYLANKE